MKEMKEIIRWAPEEKSFQAREQLLESLRGRKIPGMSEEH